MKVSLTFGASARINGKEAENEEHKVALMLARRQPGCPVNVHREYKRKVVSFPCVVINDSAMR